MIGGRFERGELIAQGAMGVVYKGLDTSTGQPVAIKQLKRDLIDLDETLIDRFQREGEALARLNHPNIVKMITALEEKGENYLIMEYVGGGSLRDLLRQSGRLPIEQVLGLSIELADALTRAHHLRIIHRDLKPDNVLLAADGTPRLTDFGLAHIGGSHLTEFGVAPGTFSYLAPEAFADQPIDARTDVWAFGVMLFELLSGQHPFEARTLEATMSAILTRPTPDLEALRPDLPIPLIDLIYRMLEKDRAVRIPNARLVGAELDAIRSGDTPAITPSSARITPSGSFTSGISSSSVTVRQPHNLPASGLAFIGRETELDELGGKLTDPDTALISLVGVGGIGKTRLAIEAARAQIGAFEHGVWLVELAPIPTPDRVLYAIAETLGFSIYPSGDPRDQVISYLREKSLLLVLDNFEHLLPAADLVSAILVAAPNVKLLVTSRERLNLATEHLYPVDGLTVNEDIRSSAIRLFVQGAVRVRPDFYLAPADLPRVFQICQRVGGLPLAILLAAAWVENLSLDEILTELEHNLDLLETDMRDIPERQRSIRAVFDSSWERLNPAEQNIFMRLSVFRGGFMREAASVVAGANLRTLTVFINRSLLRRSPTGRYEIHELLRQYAESRLEHTPDALEAARAKHAAYYMRFLAEQDRPLQGTNQKAALLNLDEEWDNLRIAWLQTDQFAVTPATDEAALEISLRSMFSLWYVHFFYRYLYEADPWLGRVEATLRAQPASRARDALLAMCLALYSGVKWQLARNAEAEACQREAESLLATANTPKVADKVRALNDFINMLMVMRINAADEVAYARQVAVRAAFAGSDQQWWTALMEIILFDTAARIGKKVEGRQHAQNALWLAGECGDQLLRGWDYALTGHLYNHMELYTEAREAGHAAEAIFGNFGLKLSTVRHWFTLSQVYANLGDLAKAEFYAREVLRVTQNSGNRVRLFSAWAMLHSLAWQQGNYTSALECSYQMIAVIRGTPNQAFLAAALINAAQSLTELRRLDQAWNHLQESLAISERIQDVSGQVDALAGFAYLIGLRGDPARAVAWLTFLHSQPVRFDEIHANVRRDSERLRSLLTEAEFVAAQDLAATLQLDQLLDEVHRVSQIVR